MSSTRANVIFALIACAVALAHVGCLAPLSAPAAATEPSPATAAPEASPTLPANDEAEMNLAGVFDKLQQVRAIDPAAEQKLLEELRQTPSQSWPLVAEQFRASLAYREQLAAKNGSTPHKAATVDAAVLTAVPTGAPTDSRNTMAEEASSGTRVMHEETLNPDRPATTEFSRDAAIYTIANQTTPPLQVPTAQSAAVVQQATFEAGGAPLAAEEHVNHLRAPESLSIQKRESEADWQQLVQKAADDLSRRVAASPSTTAEVHQHVSLRILHLLAGDTESALEPIPHISPLEQDYWSRQLFALATYLDHHSQPDDKRRAAASVTHLDEAVSHLREMGSLSLRNLSFCKTVYGYGAIEPYKNDQFAPGDEISLYVEVENYHSQSTEKGFCTLLGSTYELLDEKGERVGGGEFPDVDDCCRSRRRDFHIQYGLSLPPKLTPGQYRLQLVVKDRQSDKIGHASAAFEIGGNSP
ncbi:MAG: hypothetical protein WD738_09395 [Pirellulales bacterium]